MREVCCIGAAASTVIPPEASLSFLGVNENTKISDITYFFANSMMRRIGISGTPSTLDKNVKTELKNAVAKLRHSIKSAKVIYPENASGLLEYDGDEISVSLEIGEAVLIFAEMRTEHE